MKQPHKAVLGIDPGSKKSGLCVFDDGILMPLGKEVPNDEVFEFIRRHAGWVAIETMSPRGQRMGHDLVATCVWVGRFQQAAIDLGCGVGLLERQGTICRHMLGNYNGNDKLIRRAVIARAKGVKMAGHCWQAAAVAITFYDLTVSKL